MNKRVVSCLAVLVLALSAALSGQETPLAIHRIWIQAVPPTVSDTAAFMTLTNSGKTPLRLVGASTPVAAMVHPMVTTAKGAGSHAMMGMENTSALEVPAGGALVLAPGGNHLMIMGLKRELKPGESVPLTLMIEPGNRQIQVQATVSKQEPASRANP